MHAVEFQAPVKDGVVHIPQKYKELHKIQSAKFVMMYEDIPNDNFVKRQEKDDIDTVFDKFHIDFSNYKFDRNEANER